MIKSLFIPHPDFSKQLELECHRLKIPIQILSNKVFASDSPIARSPAWCQQIWKNCEVISFSSITDAAKKLKTISPRWQPFSYTNHRRTNLISANLNTPKIEKIKFFPTTDKPAGKSKVGFFLLLDEKTLVASVEVTPAVPEGLFEFIEDKTAPSRAYLKLWEFFTRQGVAPLPSEFCVDLGSCPGGWTWVLAQFGGRVLSVDQAPLDKKVLEFKNVEYLKKDAFKIEPESLGPIDWLFADIICEPKRILDLILKFLKSGKVRNFVITIKFKGETDFKVVDALKDIDGGNLIHLSQNKHELTFFLLRNK